MPPSLTAEDWGRETAWVARLARSLVSDPHAADDVAQDAWLLAMRTESASGGFRAWMASVVRNAARVRARGESRRRQHEALARELRTDTSPDPAASVASRLETQAQLLGAVRALDAAHRTVIVLRYFEGWLPRRIASELQIPVRTVHTRLHRALQRLRDALDRSRDGDRRAWLLPMAALARPSRFLLSSTVVMKGKLVLGFSLAALAMFGALAAWAMFDRSVPVSPAGASVAPAGALSAKDAPTAALAVPAAARQPVTDPAVQVGQPPVEPPATHAVDGLVVDENGNPLPNVELQLLSLFGEQPQLEAPLRTGTDGRFAGRGTTPLIVRVVDAAWVDVLEPHLYTHEDHPDLTVVVAPAIAVQGLVVDTDAGRIEGAQVSIDPGHDLRALPGRRLDRCVDVSHSTRTDAEGRFAFARAPRFDGGRLHALAPGFQLYGGDSPRGPTPHLQVVLQRDGIVLEGKVLDPHDMPVRDALVTLGGTWARSGVQGRFRIPVGAAQLSDQAAELRALCPGHQSARVTSYPGHDPRTRRAWPQPLVLRLGAPPLSIAGRVFHADGRPVADPQVWLLAGVQPIPDHIEFTEGGLELAMQGSDVETKSGAFELRGLDPGSYRLRVLDPATHQSMVTAPLAAGLDDVEIRLPDVGCWPALFGVVVDRRGQPVAGADWSFDGPAPQQWGEARLNGPFGHADGQGRIVHPALSRAIDTLLVKGPGMADWERFALADLKEPGGFQLSVPVGCQVQVILADGGGADSVAFIDSKGRMVPVVVTHGNAAWGSQEVTFTDGATQTFMAPDDLVELVLRKGGQVVRRVPVTIEVGKLNILRP